MSSNKVKFFINKGIRKEKLKSNEANTLNRDSKVNSHSRVGLIGQYFAENEYADCR